MTYIDNRSAVTIQVLRKIIGSQSTSGDYIGSTVTILSDVVADIQPNKGDVVRTPSGESVMTEYKGFLRDYTSTSIAVNDIVVTDTEELEVMATFDWGEHIELFLNKGSRG